MNRVADYDQYLALVRQTKAKQKSVVTNCFLFQKAVQRYLDLGRFLYEENEAGILFFSDEETYYQVYYYLNPERPFEAAAGEKPLVVNHLFTEGKKGEKLARIDERLASAGFELALKVRQTTGEPDEILKRVGAPSRVARRLLSREGFELRPVGREAFDDYFEMRSTTKEVPFYQFPYSTLEELDDDAANGRLIGIFDSRSRLCAVRHSFMEGNGMYGWIMVREAYKDRYGMALPLSEFAMQNAKANGNRVYGWIALDNAPSIQYHMGLGYCWTNRRMDTWIKPAAK